MTAQPAKGSVFIRNDTPLNPGDIESFYSADYLVFDKGCRRDELSIKFYSIYKHSDCIDDCKYYHPYRRNDDADRGCRWFNIFKQYYVRIL